jgi:hypothetical protein
MPLQPGKPRYRKETLAVLRSYFTEACHLGTQTKIKTTRTQTGVKDTFQLHFLNKLFDSYKNRRTESTKQAALDTQISQLPQDPEVMINPVWRVKGMLLRLFLAELET